MPARSPRPPSDDLLARAADLRAAGQTWEQVAAGVKFAADTVRKWPTRYPDRWKAAAADAERAVLAEATFEAVHTLRKQLRSDDEKAVRAAAHTLLQLRMAMERSRGRSPPSATPDPDPLRGLSDDHLLALLAAAEAEPPSRTAAASLKASSAPVTTRPSSSPPCSPTATAAASNSPAFTKSCRSS